MPELWRKCHSDTPTPGRVPIGRVQPKGRWQAAAVKFDSSSFAPMAVFSSYCTRPSRAERGGGLAWPQREDNQRHRPRGGRPQPVVASGGRPQRRSPCRVGGPLNRFSKMPCASYCSRCAKSRKGCVQHFGAERGTRHLCKAEQSQRKGSAQGLHGLMSEKTGSARPRNDCARVPRKLFREGSRHKMWPEEETKPAIMRCAS